MRNLILGSLLVGALGVFIARDVLASSHPRYLAVWHDGTQTRAGEVQDWGRTDCRPNVDGHFLFDAKNPLRTLEDTTLPRAVLSRDYVEFHGGDRLAGRVVRFVEEGDVPEVPAHLIVEPSVDLSLPKVFSRSQVRVRADWVQRIVRRPPAGTGMPPKSITVLNGAPESFRSFHWRPDGISILTESGPKQVLFTDLATFDTGAWQPWEAWQRQLAALSPTLASPILRMDLADGTRLTTSLERMRARSLGSDEPEKWFHLVQPAWSLDLLAVPHRKIRRRTLFGPHEAPLSAIEPSASRHRAIFSQAWGIARTDANVRGEALRAAGREFGWGFGVHAAHELEFELPRPARTFHAKVALDPTASGCARARVQLGERSLFESPPIIASGQAVDCGPLSLTASRARLVLIADAVVAGRPTGAEPFDIGDLFNWLEPIIEFDPTDLRREVEPQYLFAHSTLATWSADPVSAGNWRLLNRFDESDVAAPCYRLLASLDGPLTLTRDVAVRRERGEMLLTLGRPGETSAKASIEISLDGRRVHREALPAAASAEPLRIAIPLANARGDSVEISVRIDPAGKPALVDWRGLKLSLPRGIANDR